MAVPVYVSDEERESSASSSPQSSTSAIQTSLHTPTNEQLVQMFLDLMNLYHGASSSSSSSPSSPICCHRHGNCGNVFFPQPHILPHTTVSYGRPTNQWPASRNGIPRRRFNSSGEDEDEECTVNECPSATGNSSGSMRSTPLSHLPVNFNFEEHNKYLADRERLQLFAGQVPKRRKILEKKFIWTIVGTAALLAVGYIS